MESNNQDPFGTSEIGGFEDDFDKPKQRSRRTSTPKKSGNPYEKPGGATATSTAVGSDDSNEDDDSDEDPSWGAEGKARGEEEEDDDDDFIEEDEDEGPIGKKKKKGNLPMNINRGKPMVSSYGTPQKPMSSPYMSNTNPYSSILNSQSSPMGIQNSMSVNPQAYAQYVQLMQQNPAFKQQLLQRYPGLASGGLGMSNSYGMQSSSPQMSQSLSGQSSLLNPTSSTTTITPPPPLPVPALSRTGGNSSNSSMMNGSSSNLSSQSSPMGMSSLNTGNSGSSISGLSTSGMSAASLFGNSQPRSSPVMSSQGLGNSGMGNSSMGQMNSMSMYSGNNSSSNSNTPLSSLSNPYGSSMGSNQGSLGSPSMSSNNVNQPKTFAPFNFPLSSQSGPSSNMGSPSMSPVMMRSPQMSQPSQSINAQQQLLQQQFQNLLRQTLLQYIQNHPQLMQQIQANPQILTQLQANQQFMQAIQQLTIQNIPMNSPLRSMISGTQNTSSMMGNTSSQEVPKTVKPYEVFGGSTSSPLQSLGVQSSNMSQSGGVPLSQYKPQQQPPTPVSQLRNPYGGVQSGTPYSFLPVLNLPFKSQQVPWPGNAMRTNQPQNLQVMGGTPPKPEPKTEMELEPDPRRRVLLSLVKQCEAYSSQIKGIVSQWHEKSLKQKAENESNPFKLPVTTSENHTNENDKETELELIRQPENLQYELRAYQLVGLNWLYLLFQQKINGILADEMGLGKTIQTIAHFTLLKQRGENKKPHLVVVPATALENWVREFATWSPSLVVHMYHGSTKERELLRKQLLPKEDGLCNFDVIITTYNLSINKADRVKFFKKFEFCYIVLDEAHSIKNVNSIRYQNLLKLAFRAQYRLMLTGTPLQNNVNELWALLNFLMPNIFGVTKDFKSLSWPEEEGKDYPEEVDRIKKIISPFILRRLKSEVLGKLPPKKETIHWCELTGYQRDLYEKTFQFSKTNYYALRSKTDTSKTTTESTDPKPKVKTEEDEMKEEEQNLKDAPSAPKEPEESLHHILMQLRKAANNTLLFRHFYTDDKLKEIEDILKAEDQKAKEQHKADELAKLQQKAILAQPPSEPVASEAPLMNGMASAQTDDVIQNDISKSVSEMEAVKQTEAMQLEPEAPKDDESAPSDTQPLITESIVNGNEKSEEKSIPFEPPKFLNADDLNEPPMDDICGICFLVEGTLLCCDGPCSRAFHLACVKLEKEPPEEEKWYCTDCSYLVQVKIPEKQSEIRPQIVKILKSLEKIEDSAGRKRAALFLYLPAREEIPDYYQFIKNPISLHHMKRKVYETPQLFWEDLKLLFNNAHTYNRPSSQIYRDASFLENVAREEFIKEFPGKLPEEEMKKKKRPPRRQSGGSASFTYISPPATPGSGSEGDSSPTPVRRSSRSKRQRVSVADDSDEYVEEEESYSASSRKRSRTSRDTPRHSSRGDLKEAPRQPLIRKKRKLEEPFLSCQDVLEDLLDQEDSFPFSAPIDPKTVPDYTKVITEPMDLGTIWNKLNASEYKNTDEFVDAVRLTFDNCLLFNEPSSEIGVSAQLLWTYFKRQCRKNKIKVPEAKAQLANKNLVTSNLAKLAEELQMKSDLEIHLLCKNYEALHHFCLTSEQLLGSSGKLIELRTVLSTLMAKNSRVLIFSQFTMVLNILEEFLGCLGYKYLRMDGSTPVLDRQMLIDEYNTNRDIFVFLLSTRAAGLGINLTSADICIFHDIDWNPEMDRQAEARVHRIGQVKEVEVIKLLARESVDEYILKLAEMKKHRNDLVMGEGKESGISGQQDMEKLSIGKVLQSIFEQSDVMNTK